MDFCIYIALEFMALLRLFQFVGSAQNSQMNLMQLKDYGRCFIFDIDVLLHEFKL